MDNDDNAYMMQAVRHYGLLFQFPSYWILMALLLSLNLGASVAVFVTADFGMQKGLLFGIQVLTVPTVVGDVITWIFATRRDAIFNMRRCSALSFSTCILMLLTIISGSLIQSSIKTSSALAYASIFSVCIALSFRYFVFRSISLLDPWRKAFSTAIQPALYFFSAIVFWKLWSLKIFFGTLLSSILLLLTSYIFSYILDERGVKAIGVGALSLLKGFVANWLEDLESPLEDYFENMGSDIDVPVALLSFKSDELTRSIIVVPGFHPGPFKNLGSSNLPYFIQKNLEEKHGVVVAVPHGTAGHEMDLASQRQCKKVIQGITDLTSFSNFYSGATRLIRKEVDSAKATCQIFGDCALVTITLSPKNMEDVPREIGAEIVKKGLEIGAGKVVVIDAHNSIGTKKQVHWLSEKELRDLRSAAEEAIALALNEPQKTFKIGVAKIVPIEFTLNEGMGSGGIVALVVTAGPQRCAYIVIDGNNMVSGLREKILEAVKNLGFEDGEILTTDTHSVNAMPLTKRGYYSLGEVIDQNKLIYHVKKAVAQALASMEKAEVSYKVDELHNIRVIGQNNVINLSRLVDSTIRFARLLFFLTYIPTTLIAILPFMLL